MTARAPLPVATVRMLGPDDGLVLAQLAREDADFDLEDEGPLREPLDPATAAAHLSDAQLRIWVAEADGRVVGFLVGHVLRMRKQPDREVLLYEIGVRAAWRGHGVGRRLVGTLAAWMRAQGIATAWVLAGNPGAERFYRACGFLPAEPGTHLQLQVGGAG